MAEAVVDHLEAVHVQVQQRVRAIGLAPVMGEHAFEPVAQVAAVGQAGQRVVHDLVLELLLDAFALEDLVAQFARALLHALFELREAALLDLRGPAPVEAVGDLRGDEAQQLLVGRPVHHARRVALHRDQPDHLVADEQRHAEPAHGRRAGAVQRDLALRRRAVRCRPVAPSSGRAAAQHVLAQAARRAAAPDGCAACVDEVRELQRLARPRRAAR